MSEPRGSNSQICPFVESNPVLWRDTGGGRERDRVHPRPARNIRVAAKLRPRREQEARLENTAGKGKHKGMRRLHRRRRCWRSRDKNNAGAVGLVAPFFGPPGTRTARRRGIDFSSPEDRAPARARCCPCTYPKARKRYPERFAPLRRHFAFRCCPRLCALDCVSAGGGRVSEHHHHCLRIGRAGAVSHGHSKRRSRMQRTEDDFVSARVTERT